MTAPSPAHVFRIDRLGALLVVDDAAAPPDSAGVWARVDKSTGFLHGRARIARTGVQVYSDGRETWGELRTADELFAKDAIDSFRRLVVTDDHPAKFVTADNARELTIGHLGDDLRRDGDWLTAPFTITDKAAIQRARDGKVELSMGYWQTPVREDGEHNGQSYRYRQTGYRGNHQAVVDKARAGPEARIPAFDGEGETISVAVSVTHEDSMQNEPKGTEPKTPSASADGKGQPAPTPAAGTQQPLPGTETAQAPAAPKIDAAAQARIDVLETRLAEAEARLAAADAEKAKAASADLRARVLKVDASIVTDGKTDTEIKAATVVKLQPAMAPKLDGASDEYIAAAFDVALETHAARKASADAQVLDFAGASAAGARTQTDAALDAALDQHLAG